MVYGYCENCQCEREVEKGDFSFNYERGTFRDYRPVCTECGWEVPRENIMEE